MTKGIPVFRGLLAFVLALSLMPSPALADEEMSVDGSLVAKETDAQAEPDVSPSSSDDRDAAADAVSVDVENQSTSNQVAVESVEDELEVTARDSAAEPDLGLAVEQDEALTTQAVMCDLPAGNYYIGASAQQRSVLDVSGGSKDNAANVQLWSTNQTAAQRWKVTVDGDGYATIRSVNSNRVLDVSGGTATNGTNVQQYDSNNTKAQKWVVTKIGDAYQFASAIDTNFVLDCSGGSTQSGTNIQIWRSNNSSAQRFFATSYSFDTVSGSPVITDGLYVVTSKLGGRVVDISGAGTQNGANAQLWNRNDSFAQVFRFTFESDTGCYLITNVNSGKRLDVDCANPINGSNVQQWSANGDDAQRWKAQDNGDGSYTFQNRGSGKVLDVSGAWDGDGANLQSWESNRSSAQKFTLSPVDLSFSGVYSIRTALPTQRFIDVPNASSAVNVQLQLFDGNGTMAQKYVIKNEGANLISIRCLASGLSVAEQDGKVVQQTTTGSDNQKWELSYNGGFVLINKASGRVMDVQDGNTGNGAKLQTFAANGTAAQSFFFNDADPVSNGCYTISPECAPGKNLDFAGGKWTDGTNLQIWSSNGGNTQKFDIIGIGGGFYRITSNLTWSNVDVSNGVSTDGTNVQMWTMGDVNAQKWRIGMTDDGWYTFQNANGKYLDIAGASNSDGANVDIRQGNGSSAQKFRITPTDGAGISGNSALDTNLRNTIFSVGKNGDVMHKCFDKVASSGYIEREHLSWGILPDQVTKARAMDMYNNGGGNCYDYASQFMWLARALGYSAQVRSGAIPLYYGQTDHGWVEIFYNNATLVCDPDLQHEYQSRNFYMVTYDDAPVEYIY